MHYSAMEPFLILDVAPMIKGNTWASFGWSGDTHKYHHKHYKAMIQKKPSYIPPILREIDYYYCDIQILNEFIQ